MLTTKKQNWIYRLTPVFAALFAVLIIALVYPYAVIGKEEATIFSDKGLLLDSLFVGIFVLVAYLIMRMYDYGKAVYITMVFVISLIWFLELLNIALASPLESMIGEGIVYTSAVVFGIIFGLAIDATIMRLTFEEAINRE